MKRVSLECGGKAPSLVFADCNLDKCLDALSHGAFLYSGQSCTAVTRILVEDAVYDSFIDDLVARAKDMKVGDPLDESSRVGPLVSDRHVQRVRELLDSARDAGATFVTGGSVSDRYVEPTVVTDVSPNSRIANEELFAPVVVVFRVEDEEEALRIANGTPYGLGASIWTSDVNRVQRLMRRIEFGDVWVNTYYRRFAETSCSRA
jgi:acyl-CoA reductase-like NAD-dependent aldehyde dehydrogenase